jgi:hypothetical protein
VILDLTIRDHPTTDALHAIDAVYVTDAHHGTRAIHAIHVTDAAYAIHALHVLMQPMPTTLKQCLHEARITASRESRRPIRR